MVYRCVIGAAASRFVAEDSGQIEYLDLYYRYIYMITIIIDIMQSCAGQWIFITFAVESDFNIPITGFRMQSGLRPV
jgi:hypothetical protein